MDKNYTENLLKTYPRVRTPLPKEYAAIYDRHYKENRSGETKASSMSNKLEEWLHKKVAKSAKSELSTLEIGAGTLNQLNHEPAYTIYDIVEPYTALFEGSENLSKIRNVYSDISDVPENQKYDRITSIACFEHICNLPGVLENTQRLLTKSGILSVSIPNEGRFLWKFAYTNTTGREFKRRFNLDYDVLMHYEHVNTADEIEALLRYYYKDVQCSLLGVGKTFSFYRHYLCRQPIIHEINKQDSL